MITELTCSTLLMLGIVTRGATLPLLPMLLVLLLVYPVDWPNNLLWIDSAFLANPRNGTVLSGPHY